MPTEKKRITVYVDPDLYDEFRKYVDHYHLSMSSVLVRHMIVDVRRFRGFMKQVSNNSDNMS